MNNELIERYIYAVTKRLPSKSREDVSNELRTLIDDMLEERCQGLTPDEKDVRVVLTELGTPDELAQQYDTSTHKYLIGPPYFGTYKYVMKIVLVCVLIGLLVSGGLSAIVNPSADLFETFAEWIGTVISGLMTAFAFVTILFAVFSYKGVKLSNNSLDELPAVPKKKQEISKSDCIVGICFSVAFIIIFMLIPQYFGAFISETKEIIPVFDVEIVRSLWYVSALLGVAGIVREVVGLIEGRYNKKVMVTTIVCNFASAVLSVWWLLTEDIINIKFVSYMTKGIEEATLVQITGGFEYIFLAGILIALTIDTVVTVVKTIKE